MDNEIEKKQFFEKLFLGGGPKKKNVDNKIKSMPFDEKIGHTKNWTPTRSLTRWGEIQLCLYSRANTFRIKK